MGRPTYFLDLETVVFASICLYKLIEDCYYGLNKDLLSDWTFLGFCIVLLFCHQMYICSLLTHILESSEVRVWQAF